MRNILILLLISIFLVGCQTTQKAVVKEEPKEVNLMEPFSFTGEVVDILAITPYRDIVGFPIENDPKHALRVNVLSSVNKSINFKPGSQITLGIHDLKNSFNLKKEDILNKIFRFNFKLDKRDQDIQIIRDLNIETKEN